MKEYIEVMSELTTRPQKTNRTGVDTLSKVFTHIRFPLEYGKIYPAVTTKQLAFRSMMGELLGFVRGADSAAVFRELGSNVWNDNANKKADPGLPPNRWLESPFRKGTDNLGRIYGVQWRRLEDVKLMPRGLHHEAMLALGYKLIGGSPVPEEFRNTLGVSMVIWRREIDQLKNAVEKIKTQPFDRRIIIDAWNPADIERMALPPCHVLQHYICEEIVEVADRLTAYITQQENDAIWAGTPLENAAKNVNAEVTRRFGKQPPTHEWLDEIGAPKLTLNLIMYQRSADWMLGTPYNIASYAAMMSIMARMTNTAVGDLHYVTGDTHLYKNHLDAAREQMRRVPLREKARLIIDPSLKNLEDFEHAKTEQFRLFNYHNRGPLKNETPMVL